MRKHKTESSSKKVGTRSQKEKTWKKPRRMTVERMESTGLETGRFVRRKANKNNGR